MARRSKRVKNACRNKFVSSPVASVASRNSCAFHIYHVSNGTAVMLFREGHANRDTLDLTDSHIDRLRRRRSETHKSTSLRMIVTRKRCLRHGITSENENRDGESRLLALLMSRGSSVTRLLARMTYCGQKLREHVDAQ